MQELPGEFWNVTRQNGLNQTQFIIRNPTFFPSVPDAATLATLSAQQSSVASQGIHRIDPGVRVPRLVQTAASMEHGLLHGTSLSLTFMDSRGLHQLRTRDINAPLPTAVNSTGLAAGPRPFSSSLGDVTSTKEVQFLVSSSSFSTLALGSGVA